jgi:hypothetical protein
VTLLERHRAYASHDDSATRMANFVALVVAWNGPLYPIYVIALIGWSGLPTFITVLATPFFAAIPWIARRNAMAGRAALPLIGTLNTIWCTKLLGADSGVQVFLLPCIILGALLFRRGEFWLKYPLIGLAILPLLIPDRFYGTPILRWPPEQEAHLASLNLISAAMLLGLIALQFSKVLAQTGSKV